MLCHFNSNNRVNNNKKTHEIFAKKSFKPKMRKVSDFKLTSAERDHTWRKRQKDFGDFSVGNERQFNHQKLNLNLIIYTSVLM